MKRTVLRRLTGLVILLAAIAIIGVVAYNFGLTHAPGSTPLRGMPFHRDYGGWGYGLGFGLFGILGFVLIGLLVFWLLAAFLAPNSGGSRPAGSNTGDLDRLRELAEMHARNELTDEEFTAAKRKLLDLQ
jgi:uncharacterized membrane protein